jgi:hypothetical protein
MKMKNADQFMRHINNLCYLAGGISFHEGILLYKKLHRVEARLNRIFTAECNGDINLSEEQEEKRDNLILSKLRALLPEVKTIFLNGDPRGYALKIKETEAQELRSKGINIYQDWGGYGILAPEF